MFCCVKKAQDFSFLWPLSKQYTSVYSYEVIKKKLYIVPS